MAQPDILVTAPLPPFLYDPLKADYRWTLATVPGVGHDNAMMAPAAARAMFETTGSN